MINDWKVVEEKLAVVLNPFKYVLRLELPPEIPFWMKAA